MAMIGTFTVYDPTNSKGREYQHPGMTPEMIEKQKRLACMANHPAGKGK